MGRGLCLSLGKLAITSATSGKFLQKPRGNVFMLHGSCDSGSGMKEWLTRVNHFEFAFPHYRILYPSAPLQKYSLLNGQESSVWFDRRSLGPEFPEDKRSLDASASQLKEFIQKEAQRSEIPLAKTVIGGFSMGGIMAMHLAFRFQTDLGGVFAMSSFLPPDSYVYKDLAQQKVDARSYFNRQKTKTVSKIAVEEKFPSKTPAIDQVYKSIPSNTHEVQQLKLPRLFMSQGVKDPLVQYQWGKSTFKKLRDAGVDGHFFTIPTCSHEIVRTQLSLLYNWIENVVEDPEPPSKGITKTKHRKHHINDEGSIPAFD